MALNHRLHERARLPCNLPEFVANLREPRVIGSRGTEEPAREISDHEARFLPVWWFWRASASTPLAVCEMDGEEKLGRKLVWCFMPYRPAASLRGGR